VRLDQLIPSFARHDAIGNHVLQVRRVLQGAGIESDIWFEAIDPALRRHARPYTEHPGGMKDGAVLYHASTGSDMAGWLLERSAGGLRIFSDYHNITPAEYFEFWLPEATANMVAAREQLAELAPVTEMAIADSKFNEEELIATGYRRTAVCRLLVDTDRYHDPPDGRTLARLRRRRDSGGSTWLFVGRIAPNKCQHDVVAAFAVYRRLFDPSARLTLVGGPTGARYQRAVRKLGDELGLGDSVELLEGVDHPELLAHFHCADVFVCLSEHEGFCVPVLEAMELGLPVVALAAAAVPETVGAGGVLLAGKDPLEVACTVDVLLGDDARRAELIAAGRRRAGELSLAHTSRQLLEVLTAALEGDAGSG
jgi:glycosyltransferase involved in cell wall biosynthesis